MTFFNKKEEVIELQLTPYGKRLLSIGKMQPTYYAFFDDDILYDSKYGDKNNIALQEQKDVNNRIKEVPRPHTQTSFVESSTQRAEKVLGTDIHISSIEREYSLVSPMGTADLEAQKIPSWSVRFLEGRLVNAKTTTIESTVLPLNIPQLNPKEITYDISIEYPEGLSLEDAEREAFEAAQETLFCEDELDPTILSSVFKDGSAIKIDEGGIILEVQELNTLFKNENFDIEVFQINNRTSPERDVLHPLQFVKEQSLIQNDILMDEDTLSVDFPSIDENHVEYYFSINVDDEIPTEVLCPLLPSDTAEGIHSRRMLNCPDVDNAPIPDKEGLYNISQEEFEECE